MPETIPSIRALAAAIGRSHTAVGKWVQRDDWPFGKPPWPADVRPAILRWAADNLQEDRSADDFELGTSRPMLIPLKDHHFVTPADLIDPACPLAIARTDLPPALVKTLTVDDVTALASMLNGVMRLAMYDHTRGEVPRRATPETYRRLVTEMGEDLVGDALNFGISEWILMRFKGRPEWAEWLPRAGAPKA